MLTKNEVKYIQSLRVKKSRLEYGQFIAEGPKMVQDILNGYSQEIVCLYATEKWQPPNPAEVGSVLEDGSFFVKGVPVRHIAEHELEKISALQTPQQILAVVKARPNEFPPLSKNKWTLLLDGIQDPGNLGSIIRIADWFGIPAIYCTPETADHYNTKVVQATMGSIWRVAVYYGDCEALLRKTDVPVYGTHLEGNDIFNAEKLKPGVIVIGSEGQGIHPAILPFITKAITIPKMGHAESLNAAVAAGIVVSQLVH